MGDIKIDSNSGLHSCINRIMNGEDLNLSTMIYRGLDPLGSAYIECNSPEIRRHTGSTYTPFAMISEMVAEAQRLIKPDIIVDCGCGSGRFSIACAKAFPTARIIAIDNSDLACSMCRANTIAAGFDKQIDVVNADFTTFNIPRAEGKRILWIGNPPYVRHHDIDQATKSRFKSTASELGLKASALSGLHAHFIATIARQWREGDLGVLVTSAEWLDVNYGEFIRRVLLEKLGLTKMHLHDKSRQVFEGTNTTAVITTFGRNNGYVDVISSEYNHSIIENNVFASSRRWSSLFSHTEQSDAAIGSSSGLVRLGSLVGVHRGVVTGNNKFWVRRGPELDGIPKELTTPIIAHAREITGECIAQHEPSKLGRLVTIPEDTETLSEHAAEAAHEIIRAGKQLGINAGYVASRRRCWWSIVPPKPPAALMTYMGRKKPTFVVNRQKLSMLNVVHGLYPKVPMSENTIERLVAYLNESVNLEQGRTYCGGLVKFEPREAEALLVPPLENLEA